MIVLMKLGASEAQVEAVCESIRNWGLQPLQLPGANMAVGIPSAIPPEIRDELHNQLASLEGVSKVTPVSRAYKLAGRELHPDSTVIDVKGVKIGGGNFVVMGGPCSIESYEQFDLAAKQVKEAGASIVRGGAFKPRTSPYAFQGLADEGLKIMREVSDKYGLIAITEVMSPDMVEKVANSVDILQIGARSMQNFPLLIEAGKSGKPVFLKRGPSATIDEFLFAAEYVLSQDNPNVILCERGIVALDRAYTRNTLDLNAVPVLREFSHLPVFVDPSHGVGVARYVPALSKAAMIVGADGLMIEMHPDPKTAKSDGAQSLSPSDFQKLLVELRKLAPAAGVQTFAGDPV
jgi:3-deoxy-7-phosphoheptulonate synthase